MKKMLMLVALATMTICAANAQKQTPIKYHGEIDLGYSIGVGTFSAGRVNIHTIQGIQIGKYFSTGLGLGLDYYVDYKGLAVPIYLNLKGYLPISEKTSPYFSFDIGLGVGASTAFTGLSGVMYTPAIGVKINKFKIQLGYNVQRISEAGIGFNLGAVQIKAGVMF